MNVFFNSGRIEARVGCGVGRVPSSIHHGRWQRPYPPNCEIFDFEKAHFCRLLSAKLKIHKHIGGMVVDSGRVIRSKSLIASELGVTATPEGVEIYQS